MIGTQSNIFPEVPHIRVANRQNNQKHSEAPLLSLSHYPTILLKGDSFPDLYHCSRLLVAFAFYINGVAAKGACVSSFPRLTSHL